MIRRTFCPPRATIIEFLRTCSWICLWTLTLTCFPTCFPTCSPTWFATWCLTWCLTWILLLKVVCEQTFHSVATKSLSDLLINNSMSQKIPPEFQNNLSFQLLQSPFIVQKWGNPQYFPSLQLLTHGRYKDFYSIPLDHYLTLGQQVVHQSLEFQELPTSPQRSTIGLHNRSWAKRWGGNHLPTVAVRWHHMFSVTSQ